MINPDDVKNKYTSMTDAALFELVSDEGSQLTMEAIRLLKAEFSKRQLDLRSLENLESGILTQQYESINKSAQLYSERFPNTIWDHIIAEKRDGKPDSEIVGGLIEKDISESEAWEFVAHTPQKLKQKLRKVESILISSFFLIIAGLSLTLITRSKESIYGVYILSWCAVAIGAVRLITSGIDWMKFNNVQKQYRGS